MQTLVVDSSVILKWILSHNEQFLEQADLLLTRFNDGQVKLTAPALAKYEVCNAIRFKSLTEMEKIDCVEHFYNLPIKYYQSQQTDGVETMILANDLSITYYDAVFLELAKRLKACLITANPKHQKNTKFIKVISLRDYK